MQAFELYFNPKNKEDLFLTSFIYTPANIYENRLGSLYVVGELTQAMPQNSHFLTNLTSIIKKEYYSSGLKKSCETSLQEALKKGNEFLAQESKNGNVGWLGNLNFGVVSFKDFMLNFAKAGDIKIFLVRSGELIDLSQSLDAGLPNPDPLKVFGSMSRGKVDQNDKIIILNKRISESLNKKQKFLTELAKASNEKEIKQTFKTHQNLLVNVSGVCLFLIPTGENISKQTVTLQNDLPSFSLFSDLSKSFVHFFYKFWKCPQIKVKINFPRFKMIKISFPKFTKPSFPKISKIDIMAAKKKIFLIVGLILVLVLCYYIFQGERAQELKDAQAQYIEAEKKVMLAENFLILKEEAKAKTLFEETLQILSPLTKRGCPLRQEALSLRNLVNQYLK